MSEHVAFVVQVGHLEKHPNADRLQVVEFFGNSTMVDMNVHEGDVGIYFPIDLQLSEEFCAANNLVRRKDETGKNVGGYLDPEKRNITAMRLRGSKSEGLYLPLTCLKYIYGESKIPLKVGDKFDVLDGHEICCKYIPKRNHARQHGGPNKAKTVKKNIAPLFLEHVETEQLAYNMDAFKSGDICEITIKLHGTSARMGYLPVLKYKRNWFDKLFHRQGKPYYDYDLVTGSRRVVLASATDGGFYTDNSFRFAMSEKVRGKLFKGETLYGEIVGFQGPNGAPIMGIADNTRLNDKDFVKRYGKTTIFSYGCSPDGTYDSDIPCCEFYAYRMTFTGEDGHCVEYSPWELRYRCEQMGIKVVPQAEIFTIPNDVDPGEYVKQKAEQYYSGPDVIDARHIREGVVIRIINRHNFAVYKHKAFEFKCLEGIIKTLAEEPDIEEAQEILDECN